MLAFYDAHVRALPDPLPAGVTAEHDGPLVRRLGGHRGFVAAPADLRVGGADLDRLIARQRDRFAGLGQAVEWKTHGHDLPADLTDRLRAAGFEPEEEETVMIAPAEDVAAEPVPPEGVVLRRVEERADLERIARASAPEATLRRIDAIMRCRSRIDANVHPQIAMEAMTSALLLG